MRAASRVSCSDSSRRFPEVVILPIAIARRPNHRKHEIEESPVLLQSGCFGVSCFSAKGFSCLSVNCPCSEEYVAPKQKAERSIERPACKANDKGTNGRGSRCEARQLTALVKTGALEPDSREGVETTLRRILKYREAWSRRDCINDLGRAERERNREGCQKPTSKRRGRCPDAHEARSDRVAALYQVNESHGAASKDRKGVVGPGCPRANLKVLARPRASVVATERGTGNPREDHLLSVNG